MYKLNTKLRDFHRNISGIGLTKFCIFSLKSVGPLVRWSVVDFEPKKSWVQAPNTPEKKNKKSKLYQTIRNQNQIFHGFKPESTNETSDRNFARDFE
jgi:hypothetical protein